MRQKRVLVLGMLLGAAVTAVLFPMVRHVLSSASAGKPHKVDGQNYPEGRIPQEIKNGKYPRTYFPGTEKIGAAEMRVTAIGTGMPPTRRGRRRPETTLSSTHRRNAEVRVGGLLANAKIASFPACRRSREKRCDFPAPPDPTRKRTRVVCCGSAATACRSASTMLKALEWMPGTSWNEVSSSPQISASRTALATNGFK